MASKVLVSFACFIALLLMNSTVGNPISNSRLLQNKKQRLSLMERKTEFWNNNQKNIKNLPTTTGGRKTCESGEVEINSESYSCENVDFESLIGIPDLLINRTDEGFPNDNIGELSDIWGWLSPSGKEITILCMTNGVRFIDGTDPTNPINLGYLPSNRAESYWCDVKVYKNTAYIVKDAGSQAAVNGIQIFDLTRLEVLTGPNPSKLTADTVYDGHGSAHNVIVNTETGFIYTVGTQGDNCNGGLHILDVSTDQLNPTFVGCAGEDGYIHDAQCVVYTGPDSRYTCREICFGFNEDTVTIYDVEDKSNIKILSRTDYTNAEYTHQGWLTTDMRTLIVDDELDEYNGVTTNTTTYIFNVSDLENPVYTGLYEHPKTSIDHNLYVWGAIHANGWGGNAAMESPPSDKYAYCANYVSGVRILDISNIQSGEAAEVGHFDVSPDYEGPEWFGSWSTYMHPSGTLAISGIERGLFFVTPRMAFNDSLITDQNVTCPSTGNKDDNDDDNDELPVEVLLLAAAGGLAAAILAAAAVIWCNKPKTTIDAKGSELVTQQHFL